jgi:peptide/nickel transport system ATP-binding protein
VTVPPLLSVKDLSVEFHSDFGLVRPVENVSFDVHSGEVLCVVGESGSGKTVTMTSILRLLPDTSAANVEGEALYGGRDLISLREADLRKLRGSEIGFIFQDALASLNPTMTIGAQIAESIHWHQPQITPRDVEALVVKTLDEVGIPSPEERALQYPFEFSGGMRQRAMIALAIVNNPKLLIADEPTTALDVTIQAQVLATLKRLTEERGSSLILITHDLGVVAEIAQRVLVMYAGRAVESGSVETIFEESRHPYTRGLLGSRPSARHRRKLIPISGSPPGVLERPPGCAFHTRCALSNGREICRNTEPSLLAIGSEHLAACHFSGEIDSAAQGVSGAQAEKTFRPAQTSVDPIVSVRGLSKNFKIRGGSLFSKHSGVRAVSQVSFDLFPGSTVGVVGESGSGKSTLARLVVRTMTATEGSISMLGEDIARLDAKRLRPYRSEIQLVLQDPSSSLNPRLTVGSVLAEAVRTHHEYSRIDVKSRVHELLEVVGLRSEHASRYPHEFSAGQRQRVAIARALAVEPSVLVLDEPVSALDVSVRAQIINLLEDLQSQYGIAFLFISHDLSVIRYVADTVLVMYLGSIVESGPTEEVLASPSHPYTYALLRSVPIDEPSERGGAARFVLRGEIPSPINPPSGCPFRTRCEYATDACAAQMPPLESVSSDGTRLVACFHPLQLNQTV